MLKQIISVCIIFLTVQIGLCQSYHIVRIDSARWRLEQRMPSQTNGGGGTVIYSDIGDSANTVKKFTALVEMRKKSIDEKVLEKEYEAMNKELARVTGKSYDDHLREAIISSLAGSWTVTKGKDTVSIIINKALKISGGTIRGEIKPIQDNDFEISGVFPQSFKVKLTSPGKMESTGISLIKDE